MANHKRLLQERRTSTDNPGIWRCEVVRKLNECACDVVVKEAAAGRSAERSTNRAGALPKPVDDKWSRHSPERLTETQSQASIDSI